jgi:hypothetical protein
MKTGRQIFFYRDETKKVVAQVTAEVRGLAAIILRRQSGQIKKRDEKNLVMTLTHRESPKRGSILMRKPVIGGNSPFA